MPSCSICKKTVLEKYMMLDDNSYCKGCHIRRRETPPGDRHCPLCSPGAGGACPHKANLPSGQPCYHGWSGALEGRMYDYTLQWNKLIDAKSQFAPNSVFPEMQAVEALRDEIPLTEDFAMFLVCSAVDALVDGDPQLPPSKAPETTLFALLVEREITSDPDDRHTLLQELIVVRAGADLVPVLARRTCRDERCVCLCGNLSFCIGCKQVIKTKGGLKTCSACKVSEYCSKTCQKRHWKRSHKHDCQHVKRILSN